MAGTVAASYAVLLADLELTDPQKALAEGRVSNLRSILSPPAYAIRRQPTAIGSYGRGTIVRWERDIDVIVAFADDPYWPRYEGNSRTFLYWVRDRLNEAYPGTKVSSKEVAVRMMLSDLQVDLVPAFGRDAQGDGFYIPNGSGGWRQTNPLYHEYLINTSDKRLGQQLKPLIKVMKAWNIANGGHLKSFHLEMIVEKMWRDATALGSLPATIAETLRAAATYVPNTFSDPWDAPQRIDDYLTSAERDLAVRLLKGDAVTAAEAVAAAAAGRQAEAVELWDRVFARKSAAFH